jgi:hypothetical protein
VVLVFQLLEMPLAPPNGEEGQAVAFRIQLILDEAAAIQFMAALVADLGVGTQPHFNSVEMVA